MKCCMHLPELFCWIKAHMPRGQMSPCPNRLHFFESRDPFYKVNLNLCGLQTSGFSEAIKQFNKQLILIASFSLLFSI